MARWQPSERMARYRKRRRAGFTPVLSEGDSWFDYPFYRNIIDLIDDAELFAHMRLEASGDTVAGMIGSATALANLRTVVEDVRPVVVLFSGGGNDMAAAAGRLFHDSTGTDPHDYLNGDELDELIDRMAMWYGLMAERIGPIAPIFAHGYDYFAPSPKRVRFNGVKTSIGPWIYPAMIAAGIDDEELRRAIAAVLVDRFNDMLEWLAAAYPREVAFVDLRGTLDIDADWENEIHPTRAGFRKVADAFMEALRTRLPDLVAERLHARLTADVA